MFDAISFLPINNYPWFNLGLIFIYLAVLVTIAENINRLVETDLELTRKIVHIGSGNVVLLAWWLQIPASIIISAAVIASLVALTSYFLPILPSINSVGRNSLGTFFYAVSIGILIFCFWHPDQKQYAVMGIMIMAWGDGLAAIIGQRFGKHTYSFLGSQKSWEGSLTMAVATHLVTSSILLVVQGNTWETWLISAIIAMVATALEAFSKLGIDNLTVPIGSATLCFALCQLFS